MASKEIDTYKQKRDTTRTLLKNMGPELAKALGKSIPVEYFVRTAMTAMGKNPKLFDCTQQSLLAALMEAAQLGLVPEGVTGQAYLVPYKNTCQLIPGYRGLLDLARDNPDVDYVDAHVVCESDLFEFQYGSDSYLHHKPSLDRDREALIAVYAVMKLKSGGTHFQVMSRQEVDKIRARSMARNNGPWVTDYPEMAKKTAIKRLVKVAHRNVRLDRAIALDTRAEIGEDQGLDEDGDFIGIGPSEEDEILAQERAEAERQPGEDG